MNNPKFNINYRRKLLYKRKRRRKLLFRLSIFLTGIFILLFFLILNNIGNKSVNKNFTSSSVINNIENKDDDVIICIDPGHGDFDTGAKSSSDILEKDIVLDISLRLGKLLEMEGIKVVYTRTNDSLPWVETANDSLKERIKISKVFNTDLFISIHCNSNYDDISAKGIETWYKSDDKNSKSLASTIQTSLLNLNYSDNRGIKTYDNKDDALAVLELNESISTLIELGFLSNTSDEKYLNSDKGKDSCAKAIKDGLLNYINSNKDILTNK